METTTVSARMQPILVLFDMHTSYFHNATDSISDTDAHKRLNTKANHIAWITGSLVQERYELASMLNVDLTSAAHELFKNHQGIKEEVTYPSLTTFRNDWDKITPVLRTALTEVSDEQLARIIVFPEMSMSLWDIITFITYREASCIGQIALWRRLLGYEAMKYM